MGTHLFNDTDLTAIANAIRTKKGSSDTMTVSDMPTEIASIPSGGGTDYMAERVQGTLSSYTIPNTVTQISAYAFYGMPITSITIPSSVTNIGASAFNSCTSLTSLTLPQTMGSISASCFSGCRNLETVTFPTSLTAGTTSFFADYYTFSNCYKLKTLVNFDPSVLGTRLPMGTFNSSALEGDITLGPEFTALMYAFNNSYSTGILYVHLTQTDASLLTSKYSLNSSAFDKTHCRLVVPVGMLSDYQAAFPTYSSIMMEETN